MFANATLFLTGRNGTASFDLRAVFVSSSPVDYDTIRISLDGNEEQSLELADYHCAINMAVSCSSLSRGCDTERHHFRLCGNRLGPHPGVPVLRS